MRGFESEVGGHPVYNSGTPYPDMDGDGISDAYEIAYGLNPNNVADGNQTASNGYTNVENFLNGLAGDPVPDVKTRLSPPTNLHTIAVH
jgi:hypothetical protein